jgi:flagellar basal body-associated protein FliL
LLNNGFSKEPNEEERSMFNYLHKRKKKGQSTLEYAILIIIIIGALLSIQVYIKRGVQGRLKSATDDIGDQFSVGNTNVVKMMTVSGQTLDTFVGGTSKSQMLTDEITTESMNSDVANQIFEYWG